jgi:signal transduction histidine kinase
MRADPHYVDLLASRAAASRERSVPVGSLETPAVADVPALVPLIESVKKHGVLQPLLVQERNGSMRVIAGRRRLAAAIAAGLREVPCIVHDLGDEAAAALRSASNIDRGDEIPASAGLTTPAADHAGETLARSLHTAASLADLLTGDISDMSRGVVGALLRAELFRATTLVQATRVLRGELPVVRGAVLVSALIDKVVQGFAAERRMRHVEFVPQVDLPPGHIVIADERLLAAALSGAAIATMALLEGLASSRIAMVAGLTASRQLTLVVSQDHVLPPSVWIDRAFDATWRERPGGAATALAMTSLQRAARMHGGDTTVTLSPRGSRVALTIPAGA